MSNQTTNAFIETFLFVIRRNESAPIEELIGEVRTHRLAMKAAGEEADLGASDFILSALGTQLWRNREQERGDE